MYNYIVRILKFLLPIVGRASVQLIADTATEVAYPKRRYSRGNGYRRYSSPTGMYGRRPSLFEEMPHRTLEEQDAREAERLRTRTERHQVPLERLEAAGYTPDKSLREETIANGGYHDIVMVAFDITGPNREATFNWLETIMPPAKGYEDQGIDIDSWWIADDDNENTDCDSAVFVKKGYQTMGRELMRTHELLP